MEKFEVYKIGQVVDADTGFYLQIDEPFRPALQALEGFSHLQVLWWFSGCASADCRATLIEESPYKKAPPVMGVFATRTPTRPNPIALTCVEVTSLDIKNGIIGLAYMDAENGSPLVDIKPYTPSVDRVAQPEVPDWCAHWPQCYEDSGNFNWQQEFNF